MPEIIKCVVQRGRVVAPISNDGLDAKSQWAAVIYPSSESSLRREWLESLNGDGTYALGSLAIGDAVEFGADYFTVGPKGGRKQVLNRWYGVVRAISKECIDFERFKSPEDAFRATHYAKLRTEGKAPPHMQLRAKRDQLEDRLNELKAEVEGLEKELAQLDAKVCTDEILDRSNGLFGRFNG